MIAYGLRRCGSLAMATLLTAAALTGCFDTRREDPEAARTGLVASLERTAELRTYTYSGTADWQLPNPQQANRAPGAGIASLVRDMLGGGRLEWSARASVTPLRFEADIKLIPSSGPDVNLPLSIADGELWTELPGIGAAGDIWAMKLEQLQNSRIGMLDPASLASIGAGVTSLLTDVVRSAEAADVTRAQREDGTVTYSLEIGQQQFAAWQPRFADARAAGADTPGKIDIAPLLSAVLGSSGKISAPLRIAVETDADGRPVVQQLELNGSADSSGTTPRAGQLRLTLRYSNWNGPVTFERTKPADTRPLEQLLQLLSGT